ncbi:MAG TPA: hypothetical protein ENK44_07285 [Caldithrix abyssi]|uniref:Uncharacterized protein n=1 Tax=Caldithrix abyssi TaxID=187145 RepID=A0A7V4U028_CALAY|nr:hypothetical protein [Caldithrix abyssi]
MCFRKTFIFVAIISIFMVTACSEKDNPTASTANGDFKVTVGSGTKPEYSWTVGKAFSVSVVRTSEPTVIVWGIATPGQGNIASPAKHGAVPTGAVATATAEITLASGVEYRVSVTLLDGKTGYTDFTP